MPQLPWELIKAVESGSPEEVRVGISTHGPFSRRDFYKLLEAAVSYNRNENVQLLMASGAQINRQFTASTDSLLHIACRNRNEQLVEILLSNGAKVKVKNENCQTPLHIAVENDLENSTELLLKYKADINAVDKNGVSPLLAAIDNGFYDIFQLLLNFKANVNCVCIPNKGYTPLHTAAAKGHSWMVCMLLENGAIVDMIIEGGFTPLHLAIENGFNSTCGHLIVRGANVNAVTLEERMTPLHYACESGNNKMVKLFIENGADINALTNENKTPLYVACERGKVDIVRLLLNNDADANIKTSHNDSPLRIACEFKYNEIVELLLDKEVDVNIVSSTNKTPLITAFANGNLAIVQLLLRKGANVEALFEDRTPLHIAAMMKGSSGIVEELLNYGANIHSTESVSKYTPLHHAAERGDSDVLKVLLSRGADTEVLTEDKNSPLGLAIDYGIDEVITVLLENGAKINNENDDKNHILRVIQNGYLHILQLMIEHCRNFNQENNKNCLLTAILCEDSYADIVAKLLEHGLRIELGDEKNGELLHAAVAKACVQIVEDLLKFGADVNIVVDSESGETPLHVSAKNKEINVAQLLLNHGADVNAVDKKGRTPITNAVEEGNLKMTTLYLRSNARVTPGLLNTAVGMGNMEMVELLLQFGADINGCDENGKTALHFAVIGRSSSYSMERQDVLKMILSRGAFIDAQMFGDKVVELALSNSYNELYSSIVQINKIYEHLPKKEVNNTKNGLTALHIAVLEDNVDVVKILVEGGAQVDLETVHGITALYMAAQLGNLRIMEMLLQQDADVNTRDDAGETPVHVAAEEGHLGAIKLLYRYGADWDFKGSGNQTARSIAEEGSRDLDSSDSDDSNDYYYRRNKTNKNRYDLIVDYFTDFSLWPICDVDWFKTNIKEVFERSNIPSDDILSENVNLIARAARNKQILQVIQSDLSQGFWNSGIILENRFMKGVERNRLIDRALKSYHVYFSNSLKLPQDCVEKIFSYFSNEELRFFVKG